MSGWAPALDEANRVRVAMAEVKRQIKAGGLDPAQVIRETDLPISVRQLVGAIPGWGNVRIHKAAKKLGVSMDAPVGRRPSQKAALWPLTPTQRERLAQEIEGA